MPPYRDVTLLPLLADGECAALCDELNRLNEAGINSSVLAYVLRLVRVERDLTDKTADRIGLV
jgi:hypothetical protein